MLAIVNEPNATVIEQSMEMAMEMGEDGMEMEISTTELVPGDIVKIEEGLNVPADLRVNESWQCKVDESALTGESMPT